MASKGRLPLPSYMNFGGSVLYQLIEDPQKQKNKNNTSLAGMKLDDCD
jgi:hypothetical protein